MLINNEFDDETILSPWQYAWSIFKKKSFSMAAMWGCIILILITLFADYIIPHNPFAHYFTNILLPPSWLENGNAMHLLGTDDLGRDSLSRLIKGIQLTLGGALTITVIIALLGTIIGAAAAVTKGIKASVLHHLLDALLTIPTLLIAFILIIIFGPSYDNCLIAVLLSLLPQFIRGIYVSIENEMHKQYVVALRLDGATYMRLMRFGILPNIVEPIITLFMRIFTMAILEIATLGYLGFGAQAAEIELGALISTYIDLTYSSPWLVIIPGITLSVIILLFNLFAEGLRLAIIEGEDA
ncbi:ABC transporter permease subunit [Psychromonas sp. MME2]|uniref:ABC transporter permease subunit n=1 Tax=unclassified Psychromonas TaxID=2614957 RepID=UPI00339BD3A0